MFMFVIKMIIKKVVKIGAFLVIDLKWVIFKLLARSFKILVSKNNFMMIILCVNIINIVFEIFLILKEKILSIMIFMCENEL